MISVRACAFVYVRVCVTFSRSPIKVSRFYIAEYITNTRFYIAEHITNTMFYIAEHITNTRFYIAEHITNTRCREAVARGQEKSRNQMRDCIE